LRKDADRTTGGKLMSIKRHALRRGPAPFFRRGAVVVQVAVGMTAILGFATLSVDVGLMYSAKAQLQNVADSAALAASSQLANYLEAQELGVSVVELATQAAIQYGEENEVLGESMVITANESEFGYSIWNSEDQKFGFVPEEGEPGDDVNAVRITARRQADGQNGPVDLIFGGIFGKHTADVQARATAILVPRDIIIVGDLSGSYSDDSELRHYNRNDPDGINLYEVWQTLPQSSVDGALLQAWLDANQGSTVEDAPDMYFELAYGFFSELGSNDPGSVPVFGDTLVNSSYSPSGDDGLIRLRRGYGWTCSELGSTNYNKLRNYLLDLGYSDYEVRCIMADTSSSSTNTSIKNADSNSQSFSSEYSDKDRYDLRVAVALGLVYWNSGISGGLCDSMGWSGGSGGWGIGTSEIEDRVDYPYPSGNWVVRICSIHARRQ